MNILKQQQINDIQNLTELAGVKLTKAQCEVAYDAVWDMIMIHQKDGDRVITPIGIFESYVRKATTYTNPQHPEGERINSPARVMPKLNYARKYDASYRDIPVNQVTLERE
jgi:nucleoid DNA-binding protein